MPLNKENKPNNLQLYGIKYSYIIPIIFEQIYS